MYKDYFRFTEMPFSIAPDPRFLYLSAQHRDALAHLLYGVQGDGGFVLLTGEVGTGKTTLCRCLLEQIDADCDVAYILNPKMNAVEMLATVCDEFHIAVAPGAASIKVLVDALNAHLLQLHQQSRRAVLIIDEAQNLDPDVLEQLRLLTNLETSTRKLLQIILIGQPELQAMLHRPELRQVAQRIVARYHLNHLDARETAAYVTHRLSVAGSLAELFPRAVLAMIYRRSRGVPRLINLVCDRALLGAFAQGKLRVNTATLRKAAREVLGDLAPPDARPTPRWQIALLTLLVGGGVLAGVSAMAPSWHIDWPSAKPVAVIATKAPINATTPATAATASAAQSALRWPDEIAPRERSEALAFRDLFKRYGIDYDGARERSPCAAAEAANLRCLTARGNFVELQRINQPALLILDDAPDAPAASARFHAVLVALNSDAATLMLAGTAHRVALTAITPLWSGNYLLLWKPPPGYNGPLTEGSRGAAVTWLRQTLAQVQGGDAEGAPRFDATLARRVKEFQFAAGIEPDGIAGELTLSLLAARLDKATPQLGANAGG